MQSLLDYPNLHDDITEEEINDIFDHHGWQVEAPGDDEDMLATEQPLPVQHVRESWRGLNSRGHPLFIGSQYLH